MVPEFYSPFSEPDMRPALLILLAAVITASTLDSAEITRAID